MASDYYRRHYGVHKMYHAYSKDGKEVGRVMAYNQKEAASELRRKRIKFSTIRSF